MTFLEEVIKMLLFKLQHYPFDTNLNFKAMECMINKTLKKLNKIKQLKRVKIEVIRRYLRFKINIDIEPLGLRRKIEELESKRFCRINIFKVKTYNKVSGSSGQ